MVLRSLLTLAASLFLGSGAMVADTPALPATSPFAAPPNSPGSATAPESVEFAGVSILGKETMVSVYDVGAKHGRWIPVGGKTDGIEVVSYDSKREQIVVRIFGQLKILNLRRGTAGGSVGGVSGSVASPAAPANLAPPAALATASEAPVAPGEKRQMTQREHEEEEARMFVSDMLEIGMQNRKAYEDAQKNSGPAASLTTGVPVGTPYTPTLFPPSTPSPSPDTAPAPSSPDSVASSPSPSAAALPPSPTP